MSSWLDPVGCANALVVLLFPYSFHVIGKSITFAFLAAICMCQGGFTWIYVPETKNKRLEEIESCGRLRNQVVTK